MRERYRCSQVRESTKIRPPKKHLKLFSGVSIRKAKALAASRPRTSFYMTSTRSNPSVGARVAVFLFLVVVTADAFGAGPWWTSGRFWSLRVAILIAAGVGAWCMRERGHRRRENALERAVFDRTRTLDCERLRERERNQILEMLVSNRPLGAVLDGVARLTGSQYPASLCAVLIKGADGYHVAAAPDLPEEWLAALRVQHAVPFEVWRKHIETRPDQNPAWKVFNDSLSGRGPAVIHSWPVGSPDKPLGALLLFYREASESGESDPHAAEAGCRMARLALEHSRLYDDLRFRGHHDSLTGLPNRALYEERLDRSLSEAGGSEGSRTGSSGQAQSS